MPQPNSEFFPAIGRVADKTDLLQEQPSSQEDENEDRPLDEVESLCMSCGEQVFSSLIWSTHVVSQLSEGNDSDVAHIYTLFQGGNYHVIQVRTLRQLE